MRATSRDLQNWVVEVSKVRCVGCGQCMMVCNANAILTEWGETHVNEDLCVLCGNCIKYCPVDALRLAKK